MRRVFSLPQGRGELRRLAAAFGERGGELTSTQARAPFTGPTSCGSPGSPTLGKIRTRLQGGCPCSPVITAAVLVGCAASSSLTTAPFQMGRAFVAGRLSRGRRRSETHHYIPSHLFGFLRHANGPTSHSQKRGRGPFGDIDEYQFGLSIYYHAVSRSRFFFQVIMLYTQKLAYFCSVLFI